MDLELGSFHLRTEVEKDQTEILEGERWLFGEEFSCLGSWGTLRKMNPRCLLGEGKRKCPVEDE